MLLTNETSSSQCFNFPELLEFRSDRRTDFRFMPHLLVHFARYGPYHHARLRAAAELLAPLGWEVTGLETAGTDATYAWDENKPESEGVRVITAFPGRVHEEITAAECRDGLPPLLDAIQPDAIAIAGWASPDALACLSWCRKNDVRRIVMSETREADGKRVWWKELVKRVRISRFDAALVGGKSHRDYLVKLGMPADKIRFGYNVVDNAYFAEECQKVRRSKDLKVGEVEPEASLSTVSNPQPTIPDRPPTDHSPLYFLASNRFIERKNLARLVEAFARFGRATTAGRAVIPPEGGELLNLPAHGHLPPLATSRQARRSSPTWDLVLLGDGELKADLLVQCHRFGLEVIEAAPWDSSPTSDSDSSASHSHLTPLGTSGLARRFGPAVFFPGFRQIEELPRFYAHAGCFVHPALEEPWGLVLNEAMACGLPVLSGSNVGAAEELVDDGVNGWKFDAQKVSSMAECLVKVAGLDDRQRLAMGAASVRILDERCPTEAFGRGLAEILGEGVATGRVPQR